MTKEKTIENSTIQTLQNTVIEWDAEWLQQAIANSSGVGSSLLVTWIVVIIILASIIETGTFFWLILPADIILSASILALAGLEKWGMVFVVTLLSIIFTIIWDQLGYYTGYKLWSWLYNKEDNWYFKKKYIIQAQEALQRSWEKVLYIGRYIWFGGILPTIYGMMKWEKKQFFKISVLSAILWKLSIIIPLVLIMFLFPWMRSRFALLLLLASTIPEIIWWIILLKPQAEEYWKRLENAKEQINDIRQNFSNIKENLWEIIEKLKINSEETLEWNKEKNKWINIIQQETYKSQSDENKDINTSTTLKDF